VPVSLQMLDSGLPVSLLWIIANKNVFSAEQVLEAARVCGALYNTPMPQLPQPGVSIMQSL